MSLLLSPIHLGHVCHDVAGIVTVVETIHIFSHTEVTVGLQSGYRDGTVECLKPSTATLDPTGIGRRCWST